MKLAILLVFGLCAIHSSMAAGAPPAAKPKDGGATGCAVGKKCDLTKCGAAPPAAGLPTDPTCAFGACLPANCIDCEATDVGQKDNMNCEATGGGGGGDLTDTPCDAAKDGMRKKDMKAVTDNQKCFLLKTKPADCKDDKIACACHCVPCVAGDETSADAKVKDQCKLGAGAPAAGDAASGSFLSASFVLISATTLMPLILSSSFLCKTESY